MNIAFHQPLDNRDKMYNPLFDNSQYTNPNQNQTYSDIQSAPTYDPQPMMGNMTESQLYPYANNASNFPYSGTPQSNFGYAAGGRVSQNRNHLPSLAEMIRQQGNNEDTILAHINPLEAMMLKQMGGSGTINPRTGLPQFGFFNKPGKATATSAGSIVGTIIGNMILPGIGGVIGGAIGQGAQHAARGKSFGEGAMKGAAIGSMTPTAAGFAGSGASALGMNTAGTALSNYGAQNSILASLGMNGAAGGFGGTGGGVAAGGAPMKEYYLSNMANNTALPGATGAPSAAAAQPGFMSQLGSNSSSFFSKPKNIASIASAVGSFAGREKPQKEKTPEQKADEQKRYEMAMMLTAQQRAAKEADMLANRQMQMRIEMNKFLPEQRFAVNPTYRKAHSPEEYRKSGNWLSYHDNPEFTGSPILMKTGGHAHNPAIEIEEFEMEMPDRGGYMLHGPTGGQDDKIHNPLFEGDFVVPADVVSHIGDGNSMAGSRNLDDFFGRMKGSPEKGVPKVNAFLSDGEYVIRRSKVTNLGKGDNNVGAKKLDNLLKGVRKGKGAKTDLPPKLKSLTSYMTR